MGKRSEWKRCSGGFQVISGKKKQAQSSEISKTSAYLPLSGKADSDSVDIFRSGCGNEDLTTFEKLSNLRHILFRKSPNKRNPLFCNDIFSCNTMLTVLDGVR